MNSDSRRVATGGLTLVECVFSACIAIALAVGLGFVPAARGGDRDHDDPADAARLIAQAEASNVLKP